MPSSVPPISTRDADQRGETPAAKQLRDAADDRAANRGGEDDADGATGTRNRFGHTPVRRRRRLRRGAAIAAPIEARTGTIAKRRTTFRERTRAARRRPRRPRRPPPRRQVLHRPSARQRTRAARRNRSATSSWATDTAPGCAEYRHVARTWRIPPAIPQQRPRTLVTRARAEPADRFRRSERVQQLRGLEAFLVAEALELQTRSRSGSNGSRLDSRHGRRRRHRFFHDRGPRVFVGLFDRRRGRRSGSRGARRCG